MSAAEIRTWCEENQSVPENVDKPFVVSFYIYAGPIDPEEQDLKIVISTRRLLSLAQKSPLVQTDATYKIVWQGYPGIIVGTTDKDRRFHPFLFAVMKGETTQDFEFVFQCLHDYHLEWQPSILLADGAEAITNAFVNVFGIPAVHIMCYFHIVQNVHLRSLGSHVCGAICADIHVLQLCQNLEVFKTASSLFLTKWWKVNDSKINLSLIHISEPTRPY